MATVFWVRHGVLLVNFMQCGTTINAVAYGQTLQKIRRAIQNKSRGMLTEGILLLRDHARPHTAAQTRALLDSFGWEVLDPPLEARPCAERFSSFPPSQTSSRWQSLRRRRDNSRDLLVIGTGGKFLRRGHSKSSCKV
ncbi:hypothetical protein AVEN_213208-1 [Araneus ventricosus]|uniref:Mariner Mos1 transposase n=1 Tax=Araneus ventricosus TaxID=182803 RepID=A0A4Y2K5C4_ARAVE|nr:hypothetical protein AVEN_256815-1 [Araneus ventricosus]GBM97541.1 hypothetical protein AVEN_213208-1 [Araneus ventricosus]